MTAKSKDGATDLVRRRMLIALATLGAGTLICSSSGAAALGWLLLRDRSLQSVATVVVPTPAPALAPPTIIDRETWNALDPDHDAPNESGYYSDDNPEGWRVYDDELSAAYQTLVLHHSAMYEGDDLRTVREIQIVHRRDRGWADVGYHFLIGRTGAIFAGRDWHVRGTHVEGYNTGSLGICLLGNFERDYPTHDQLTATRLLIVYLARRLQVTHLADHHHFNAQTACPGAHLRPYATQFADAVGLQIGVGGYTGPNA